MTDPPTDRSDEVATKADIGRLEARFDRLEERLNGLYETIIDQQRFYTRNTVWSMVGLTAIFSLVVAFFG